MSVRITSMDFSGAVAKAGLAEKRVRTLVSLRVRDDCTPLVPYVTGALRASAETESQPEKGLVAWGNSDVPYARAQYYACPNKTFPGTTKQWFEEARNRHEITWRKTAEEALKEVFR